MRISNCRPLVLATMLLATVVGPTPARALDLLPSFKSTALEVWTQDGESVQLDTWRALGENRNPKSDHPWQVTSALMARLLAQVRVAVPSGSQPLLEAAQIERLATPLATAFGRADARLDVVFALRDGQGGWTRGRLFYVKGQLNLIAGGRGDEDRTGERGLAASGAPTLLAVEPSGAVRADWIQLPVQQLALEAAAPTAAAKTAALEAENARLKTELAAQQPAAIAAPAAAAAPPLPAAAPAAVASPVPASGAAAETSPTAACLGDLKQRLAAVDALRAAGTIDEEERRSQRKRILDEL